MLDSRLPGLQRPVMHRVKKDNKSYVEQVDRVLVRNSGEVLTADMLVQSLCLADCISCHKKTWFDVTLASTIIHNHRTSRQGAALTCMTEGLLHFHGQPTCLHYQPAI